VSSTIEAARNPSDAQRTFLHGTNTRNLPNIQAKGLIPRAAPGADAWAQQRNRATGFKIGRSVERLLRREPSVFITQQSYKAVGFASLSTLVIEGSKPVVIQLVIPQEFASRIEIDEFMAGGFRYPDVIPPTWIVEAREVAFESYLVPYVWGDDDQRAQLLAAALR
jgi:hypothetical protein